MTRFGGSNELDMHLALGVGGTKSFDGGDVVVRVDLRILAGRKTLSIAVGKDTCPALDTIYQHEQLAAKQGKLHAAER